MEITIYRRHSAGCKRKGDRYHPRCGCPLWFQFNWSQSDTTLDGKKLRRGQNKWSAQTCIWSDAQTKAKRLNSDLEALLQGKPVRQNITLKAAVDEWLEFRSTNKLDNTKADLMGRKLTQWCENNDVVLLSAITTERVMKFRMSLPFRTGNSSSLFSLGSRRGPLQLGGRYGLHRKELHSEHSAASAVSHSVQAERGCATV
jgi:hypothetical protein